MNWWLPGNDLYEYQARINSVDAQLGIGAKSSQDSAALVALRQRYVSEMNARPPLVLVGMVGNWLNEIWANSGAVEQRSVTF